MALIIDIKVVPSSGKQMFLLDKNGTLKCCLKSPPEQGKANKELITLLAKTLKLTQADIQIIQGATSRIKKIKIITSMHVEQLLTMLGIEKQMKIGE